ncbi:hypothetical protein I638_mgp032 (mitochondrion) [Glycine max]|uniref:Uncharacterized protein n=1 Tax=Glycine max TaxID=3847 RepID=M1FPA7_SOYBN|nr:hypothetical protein I638_mgp032 [Glycine max]AFR34365.1 hypothetical protein GlmaxMp59 [Glycine max]|eukprot:YP_007516908.1 hypothetical protein GlmaxMp59 (mitochondrion) [Glycine max]
MDRRAQPDPVQFVFCGNTRFKFKGREKKRKRNSLLSSYSFSLPCGGLSGVYGGSDQSREEVFSDLPLRKVSSRQLNLPGKLVGAPHGLVIGRGECLFIRGFISFIMN